MALHTVDVSTFETVESGVSFYSRCWPTVFNRALGSHLYDENGRPYLDFFSGAGALNYGHNNTILKRALLDYIEHDGVTHALDMSTVAKRGFLDTFARLVLAPRELPYKVMFPGPTGANAVEAALKLARKVTGRQSVISFTNGFHGMSLGALAVTGNAAKRAGAGVPLTHTIVMPYDGYLGPHVPDFAWFDHVLGDAGSGIDHPAAVIVETVQGEGGVAAARPEWLRGLAERCRHDDMLLIVDDIQMGCGRTGRFFSFEEAGIVPDIVTLSKSISGYGLPMSLVLFRPELDLWQPGEHNGTFRGNNHAFVTAAAALEAYWADDALWDHVLALGERVAPALAGLCETHPESVRECRGRGLVWGVEMHSGRQAVHVARQAFESGLLVETCGPDDATVKLLPALTSTPEEIDAGLNVLAHAVRTVHAEVPVR